MIISFLRTRSQFAELEGNLLKRKRKKQKVTNKNDYIIFIDLRILRKNSAEVRV